MEQRQRAREITQAPPVETPFPAAADTAPAGRVRLIAGAEVQEMDLGGRTVAEARAVAQAIFGVTPNAEALLDGRAVDESQRLEGGQMLEFTRRAGQKGALPRLGRRVEAPIPDPVVVIRKGEASWGRDERKVGSLPLPELVARLAAAGLPRQHWRMNPPHVRFMIDRGRATGVVIEMPPGPRQVRWIADDSPESWGEGATYVTRTLSFPWIVLLVIFVNGSLTGQHQAFYRTAPLASLDDHPCETNLLNVVREYGQESWVCLLNMRSVGRMAWDDKIRTITNHFWFAAFNRSADEHEGTSAWATLRGLDPRLETPAAWEAATRAQPYFTLDVPWPRVARSVGDMLEAMLAQQTFSPAIESAEQLVTLMMQQRRR